MDKRHNNMCVCNYISIYIKNNFRLEALSKEFLGFFVCLFLQVDYIIQENIIE